MIFYTPAYKYYTPHVLKSTFLLDSTIKYNTKQGSTIFLQMLKLVDLYNKNVFYMYRTHYYKKNVIQTKKIKPNLKLKNCNIRLMEFIRKS